MLRGHFAAQWDSMDAAAKAVLRAAPAAGGTPRVEPAPDGNPAHRAVTFLHAADGASAVILSANALVNHRNVAASEFERVDPACGR